jgi:hypothetical protein
MIANNQRLLELLSCGLCWAQGSTTDPTRPVQLWALDFSFMDGTYTKRDLGQVSPPRRST